MKYLVHALPPFLACLWLTPTPGLAQDQAVAANASVAAAECSSPQNVPVAYRRVIDKAQLGIGPLRQHVHITQIVYGLDLMETVAWLDNYRATQRECARAIASATPG